MPTVIKFVRKPEQVSCQPPTIRLARVSRYRATIQPRSRRQGAQRLAPVTSSATLGIRRASHAGCSEGREAPGAPVTPFATRTSRACHAPCVRPAGASGVGLWHDTCLHAQAVSSEVGMILALVCAQTL